MPGCADASEFALEDEHDQTGDHGCGQAGEQGGGPWTLLGRGVRDLGPTEHLGFGLDRSQLTAEVG